MTKTQIAIQIDILMKLWRESKPYETPPLLNILKQGHLRTLSSKEKGMILDKVELFDSLLIEIQKNILRG